MTLIFKLKKFFIIALIVMTIMIVITVGFFIIIMRGIFHANS